MAAESSKDYHLQKILQDQRAKPCDVPLQWLRDITDNFSKERIIGSGGFGVVYKGILQNGQVIAVKKLNLLPGTTEQQFENEIFHLMRLKHKNIVRLIGYCYDIQKECIEHENTLRFAEKLHGLLCLEFLPEGSLHKHISNESSGLDWQKRYKIIMGICRGLHYLHEEWEIGTPIIHLDLKPQNILLEHDMVPKIADFGLSRLFGPNQTRVITKTIHGSMGYIAREYMDHGIISIKTDIFSIGVIIIEIILGHKNYLDGMGTSKQGFVEHVLRKWRNRLEKLGSTSIEEDCEQIKACIEIGLNCVHTDAARRPTTREIIECLDSWESTYVHISNEKKSAANQAQQNLSNTSEAAQNSTSPEMDNQITKRGLETDMVCKDTGLVRRPGTMESAERLNEVRPLADKAMAITEVRHRRRRVNDDQTVSIKDYRSGRSYLHKGKLSWRPKFIIVVYYSLAMWHTHVTRKSNAVLAFFLLLLLHGATHMILFSVAGRFPKIGIDALLPLVDKHGQLLPSGLQRLATLMMTIAMSCTLMQLQDTNPDPILLLWLSVCAIALVLFSVAECIPRA